MMRYIRTSFLLPFLKSILFLLKYFLFFEMSKSILLMVLALYASVARCGPKEEKTYAFYVCKNIKDVAIPLSIKGIWSFSQAPDGKVCFLENDASEQFNKSLATYLNKLKERKALPIDQGQEAFSAEVCKALEEISNLLTEFFCGGLYSGSADGLDSKSFQIFFTSYKTNGGPEKLHALCIYNQCGKGSFSNTTELLMYAFCEKMKTNGPATKQYNMLFQLMAEVFFVEKALQTLIIWTLAHLF